MEIILENLDFKFDQETKKLTDNLKNLEQRLELIEKNVNDFQIKMLDTLKINLNKSVSQVLKAVSNSRDTLIGNFNQNLEVVHKDLDDKLKKIDITSIHDTPVSLDSSKYFSNLKKRGCDSDQSQSKKEKK